jgi:Fe-Mn family superoxide dismutase
MKRLENRANFLTKKIQEQDSRQSQTLILTEMKKIGIEKLPYSYSALKKFIDSKTMDVHYNKHYKGYVEKLNKALKKKDYGDLELEQIVKSINRFDTTIRNNAGGAFNHALFWKMLSPKKQNPSGELLEKIKKDFGSYEKFKKEFEQVSKDRFGSGWAWLILTKTNKLKIISTPNQDNPLMLSNKEGGYPILGLDLWEHAYYLKYQNKRDEYIQNFWDVVNWKFVNDLFEMKSKTKLKENLILKNVLKETNFDDTKESIRFIFNMNPKVKSIFKESINSIFENVITENYSRKSFINKLQTNPLAFSVLLEHTNNLLEKENKEKIEIIGVPITKQINETIRFVLFLENNKSRFFNTNSSVFKKLLSIIESYNQKI